MVFWRVISSVCLCPMTPPAILHSPLPLHHQHHLLSPTQGAIRVCAQVCVQPSTASPLAWEPLPGLVQSEGWGVRACTVNYLCGPRMEDGGQGCVWRSFYPRLECLLSIFSGMPTLRHFTDNTKQGKSGDTLFVQNLTHTQGGKRCLSEARNVALQRK